MSNLSQQESNPLLELLAGKVLGDLSPEEIDELNESEANKYRDELLELEQAAAGLQLVFQDARSEAMPEALRRTILLDAPKYLSAQTGSTLAANEDAGFEQKKNTRKTEVAGMPPQFSSRETIAWLACAASLLLTFSLWFSNQPSVPAKIALSDARNTLMDLATDLVRVDWKEGKTPLESQVTGDVVWSNDRQAGYMRFTGMQKNDPTEEQYQLWIIDPSRDDEPIDGGVFDIESSGEVIVKIDAKLKVLNPAAFAITIEKPGGVVVSTQERLPLLAVVQ